MHGLGYRPGAAPAGIVSKELSSILANTLLVTFGCSWTFGVGVNYEPGISEQEMMPNVRNTEICDRFSWRGLLSQKYHLHNLNLARGGSSNQRQFRLATEFFGSPAYQNLQKQFNRIVVIWGITSTARNDMWSLHKRDYHNFFLSDSNDEFARFMVEHSYDHDCEVHRLRDLMLYWNVFFESQHIKNFWFDTFNTHHYTHNFLHTNTPTTYLTNQFTTMLSWPSSVKPLDHICNLLDFDRQPRDLMSWLMVQNNIPLSKDSQSFHNSSWQIDRDGMLALVDAGILNPYSTHPTKLGHRQLCDYFANKLQAELA